MNREANVIKKFQFLVHCVYNTVYIGTYLIYGSSECDA